MCADRLYVAVGKDQCLISRAPEPAARRRRRAHVGKHEGSVVKARDERHTSINAEPAAASSPPQRTLFTALQDRCDGLDAVSCFVPLCSGPMTRAVAFVAEAVLVALAVSTAGCLNASVGGSLHLPFLLPPSARVL